MKKVIIPKPCSENIAKMKPCAGGVHCGSCKTDLIDLRKKDEHQIKTILENNPGACIIIDAKHIDHPHRKTGFAGKAEKFFSGIQLKPVSVVLVAVLLFLSSCHKKHKHFVGKFKTEPKEEVK